MEILNSEQYLEKLTAFLEINEREDWVHCRVGQIELEDKTAFVVTIPEFSSRPNIFLRWIYHLISCIGCTLSSSKKQLVADLESIKDNQYGDMGIRMPLRTFAQIQNKIDYLADRILKKEHQDFLDEFSE